MEKIDKMLIKEINKNLDKQIVFLCIGTKNVVGDTLGPAVGEKLMQTNLKNNIIIKGNFSEPLHYLNIQENLMNLNKTYNNLYTIIVDASLYSKAYIGKIVFSKNKITLGDAFNKNKYKIGDFAIKGIVGEDYKSTLKNMKVLETVPKQLIQKMSEKIANQILTAVNKSNV